MNFLQVESRPKRFGSCPMKCINFMKYDRKQYEKPLEGHASQTRIKISALSYPLFIFSTDNYRLVEIRLAIFEASRNLKNESSRSRDTPRYRSGSKSPPATHSSSSSSSVNYDQHLAFRVKLSAPERRLPTGHSLFKEALRPQGPDDARPTLP